MTDPYQAAMGELIQALANLVSRVHRLEERLEAGFKAIGAANTDLGKLSAAMAAEREGADAALEVLALGVERLERRLARLEQREGQR